jgi:hypothetical protein
MLLDDDMLDSLSKYITTTYSNASTSTVISTDIPP